MGEMVSGRQPLRWPERHNRDARTGRGLQRLTGRDSEPAQNVGMRDRVRCPMEQLATLESLCEVKISLRFDACAPRAEALRVIVLCLSGEQRLAFARALRIVPEELGDRLLEVAVVLVGIFLDVERFGRGAAPHELLGSRVEHPNDQLAHFYGR
jgi:hypothetical protein